MASRTQETLFSNFQALASDRGLSSVASTLERTVTQIGQLQTSGVKQSERVGSAVVSTVSKIFTSGLGLVPLVSGLFGLFGGGGTPEPPPLIKYTMPERLYFQGADTGGDINSTDYDQMGTPRAYGTPGAGGSSRGTTSTVPTGSGVASGLPQINVNVQAMDSRSFLDHSTEIAQAVRQAMLTLNSVNDVVNDL